MFDRSGFFYIIFVCLAASSPVFSLYASELFGMDMSMPKLVGLMLAWFPISLPVSFLAAKLAGAEAYRTYWTYLERKSAMTQSGIMRFWVGLSVFLAASGILLFGLR